MDYTKNRLQKWIGYIKNNETKYRLYQKQIVQKTVYTKNKLYKK